MDGDQNSDTQISMEVVFDKLSSMESRMEDNFSNLHAQIAALNSEFKEGLNGVRVTIKELEKSLNNAWAFIEDIQSEAKALKDSKSSQQQMLEEQAAQIKTLEANLTKLETEINYLRPTLTETQQNPTALENYTRRENLRFMNIPESRGEDCQDIIYDLIENDLKINAEDIRFHAVHRVGKSTNNDANAARPRPIIARFVVREDRDAVLASDHQNQKRGPGFWKFNTALLKDEKYISAIKLNIPIFKKKCEETQDLGLKWDLIKMEIRGFTIQYSKRKAKKHRDEEKILYQEVNTLQAKAEKNPHDRNIILELQRARSRLKKITLTKTKGAILRSKVRWHEEGERNSKYFYSLEKRHHDIKTVSKLKVGENSYIEDQFKMLEEEKNFYEVLYRSNNINDKKFKNSPFFNPEIVTTLSEEEKVACEGLVNEEECINAFKDFSNNKTPGTDGLPAEFYRFFWPDICFDLQASYNYAFQHGTKAWNNFAHTKEKQGQNDPGKSKAHFASKC
ncbi:hypothetical protein ACROYT_G027573 [Oculina patagonica]